MNWVSLLTVPKIIFNNVDLPTPFLPRIPIICPVSHPK